MKHSPTPWKQSDHEPRMAFSANGVAIFKAYVGDMSHEDTAFAVRAANCHEELVAALEWLEFAVRDSGIEWEQQSQLSQAMPNAHAALAKASHQPAPKEDKPLDGLPDATRFPRWKERP